MRFKLLNFKRTTFLMLLKKAPSPALENLSLRTFFGLFYIISTQTIYIYQKFHEMNRFVKLRVVSKLSTFLYTVCNNIYKCRKHTISRSNLLCTPYKIALYID
jgi:predicted transporter